MNADVLIVGGGLIGVTTAHRLAKRGHSIVLLEAGEEVGLGANYANGAMLVPSQTAPWNTPGILSTLVTSFVRNDPTVRIRLNAVPSLINWGLQFLKNAKPHLHEFHLRKILDLALYSMEVFEEYFQGFSDRFDARKCGTIKIYRDQSSLQAQIRSNRQLDDVGLEWKALTPQEIAEAEPHLQGIVPQLAGGIRFPADIVADSRKFCRILRDDLVASGHVVHTGCRAAELLMSGDEVVGARTTIGDVRAKNTVLALGANAGGLAQAVLHPIMVRPVKGYSLTYDTATIDDLPKQPVVDEGLHVGVVPLSGKLRVVGIAEFAGFDGNLRPEIVNHLDRFAKRIYPQFEQAMEGCEREPWAGFRAMSADGLPYIGRTTKKGLWVNTGHGHLGWTLAAGAAELLTDLITGNGPELDAAPYAVTR